MVGPKSQGHELCMPARPVLNFCCETIANCTVALKDRCNLVDFIFLLLTEG